MLRDDLKPYIDRWRRREITGREVARLLGTNETYVCRTFARMGVKREDLVRAPSSKELREQRAEFRRNAAATMPVKAAAKAAHCSERTIYRIKAGL
jgi:AraC-like DNA-binding protein